jgi:putative redox protein
VTAFEVQVHADQRNDHPHVFTKAIIAYLVTGHNVDEAAVSRAIELSATKYCPVQAMLANAVPMELVYEIYEEKDGTNELVKKGEWKPVR